jgi:hypothetical protein
MDRIDLSLGSLGAGSARIRRQRPLAFDQEKAAAEAVMEIGPEQSLGHWVPSALIPTEKRMLALAVAGAPAWSRRLRRMDALIDRALEELEAAWRALAGRCSGEPGRFADEWRAEAERYDFSAINDLVRRHNLYFPAEANLAMDPRTGDFVGLGGGDYRRRSLDARWVLERFPADLSRAC